jgi:hypothetical protein
MATIRQKKDLELVKISIIHITAGQFDIAAFHPQHLQKTNILKKFE